MLLHLLTIILILATATAATNSPHPAPHHSRRPSRLSPFPHPPLYSTPVTARAHYWDPKHNACLPCAPHATSCVYSDWATACEAGCWLVGGECFEGRVASEEEAVRGLRKELEAEVGRMARRVKVEVGRVQKVFGVGEASGVGEEVGVESKKEEAPSAQPTLRVDDFFVA